MHLLIKWLQAFLILTHKKYQKETKITGLLFIMFTTTLSKIKYK
jgi:hypothetical protein